MFLYSTYVYVCKYFFLLQVQHEATWFAAGDCLLSGGGILQYQSDRISAF